MGVRRVLVGSFLALGISARGDITKTCSDLGLFDRRLDASTASSSSSGSAVAVAGDDAGVAKYAFSHSADGPVILRI